jgi:hypothetical protein
MTPKTTIGRNTIVMMVAIHGGVRFSNPTPVPVAPSAASKVAMPTDASASGPSWRHGR